MELSAKARQKLDLDNVEELAPEPGEGVAPEQPANPSADRRGRTPLASLAAQSLQWKKYQRFYATKTIK